MRNNRPRYPTIINHYPTLPTMTVSTLTIDERQSKLEALASYSPETLAGSTVRELRQLVAGVVTAPNKFRKADLLSYIADLTADIRFARRIQQETAAIAAAELQERNQELEAAALSPASPDGYRAAAGITSVEDIIGRYLAALDAPTTLYGCSEEVDKLVTAADILAVKYCFEQQVCYQPTTRKSNTTKMFKALDEWQNSPESTFNIGAIKVAVMRFKKQVSAINKDQNIAITANYVADVKTRIDGRKYIKALPLLERAVTALENLSDYREVAVALALVTGRRMGEIMSSGVFKLSETPNHILFSGISKGRGSTAGNDSIEFDIPVLAEPELILKAIQYLIDGGYRPDDIKDVNRLYSKPLSRQMVKWSELSGQPMEYKSLRALYATVCFEKFAESTENENSYFAKILGHGEKDIATAFSYMVWNIID